MSSDIVEDMIESLPKIDIDSDGLDEVFKANTNNDNLADPSENDCERKDDLDINENLTQFTESISAINSLVLGVQVVKAKRAFLSLLSAPKSYTQEDYTKAGQEMWDRITQDNTKSVHLFVANLDFSDLTKDLIPLSSNNEKSLGIVHTPPQPPSTLALSPPPPSTAPGSPTLNPPPPPIAPPSPTLCPPPPPNVPPSPTLFPPPPPCQSKPMTKLQRLHWRPLSMSNHSTIWSNLPQIEVANKEMEALFRVPDKVKIDHTINHHKPKQLAVLDSRRSNQINIALTHLPPISCLTKVIEDMDDSAISREGLDKIISLLPNQTEVDRIKLAQEGQGEDKQPLGQAEQFLISLNNIENIECKLKLWMFKLDFKVLEDEICLPYRCLLDGMKAVRINSTFSLIMGTVLEMGNIMNGSRVVGFNISFLGQLSSVKDTVTKRSLLYHVVKRCQNSKTFQSNLLLDFSPLSTVAKTDFCQLKDNLSKMEVECKSSLGYLQLGARYDESTHDMVSDFLKNSVKDLSSIRIVVDMIDKDYKQLLFWFGLPSHVHSDFEPRSFANILVEFAREVEDVRMLIKAEKAKDEKNKNKSSVRMRRNVSMIDVNWNPAKLKESGNNRKTSFLSPTISAPPVKFLNSPTVDEVHEEATGLEEILDTVVFDRGSRPRRSGRMIRQSVVEIPNMESRP